MDSGRNAAQLREKKMKGKIMYLINRLREPSTMAGLCGLAVLFGVPAGTIDAVAKGVGAAVGLAAVLLPETKAD